MESSDMIQMRAMMGLIPLAPALAGSQAPSSVPGLQYHPRSNAHPTDPDPMNGYATNMYGRNANSYGPQPVSAQAYASLVDQGNAPPTSTYPNHPQSDALDQFDVPMHPEAAATTHRSRKRPRKAAVGDNRWAKAGHESQDTKKGTAPIDPQGRTAHQRKLDNRFDDFGCKLCWYPFERGDRLESHLESREVAVRQRLSPYVKCTQCGVTMCRGTTALNHSGPRRRCHAPSPVSQFLEAVWKKPPPDARGIAWLAKKATEITDDPHACQTCSASSICPQHEPYFCNCARSGPDCCKAHSQELREPYFEVLQSAEMQSREPGNFQPNVGGYDQQLYDDMASAQTASIMSSNPDLSPPGLEHFESPEDSMSMGPNAPHDTSNFQAQYHDQFDANNSMAGRVSHENYDDQDEYQAPPVPLLQSAHYTRNDGYQPYYGHRNIYGTPAQQGVVQNTSSASFPKRFTQQAEQLRPLQENNGLKLFDALNPEGLHLYPVSYDGEVANNTHRSIELAFEQQMEIPPYEDTFSSRTPSTLSSSSDLLPPDLEHYGSPMESAESAFSGPSTPEEELPYAAPVQAAETGFMESWEAEMQESRDYIYSICRCESGICFMHDVGLEFMKQRAQ